MENILIEFHIGFKMTVIELNNILVQYDVVDTRQRTVKGIFYNFLTSPNKDNRFKNKLFCSLDIHHLKVNCKETIAIIGANGAGKTTLLKLVSGLLAPSSGSVTINGRVTPFLNIALGFDDELSAIDNIYLRGFRLGLNKHKIKAFLTHIIHISELEAFAILPLKTYSTGMRMRLAFSIAVTFTEDILVMDEWLSVGDEHFSSKAQAILRECVDKSAAFIIATHNLTLVKSLCERTIFLDKGKIVADGPSEEVIQIYQSYGVNE
tara:strand:+ start:1609 stop:2400 length:792 start_codon:yes stop_codon:yes gene_type:complete